MYLDIQIRIPAQLEADLIHQRPNRKPNFGNGGFD